MRNSIPMVPTLRTHLSRCSYLNKRVQSSLSACNNVFCVVIMGNCFWVRVYAMSRMGDGISLAVAWQHKECIFKSKW